MKERIQKLIQQLKEIYQSEGRTKDNKIDF